MFDKTRSFLESLGLPGGDAYDLPSSEKRFGDGAHYRLEVPTINTAKAMQALVEQADKNDVVINRVDETYGAFRHTLDELREYRSIARDWGLELNMSVGPRAPYDTGATVQTSQGVRIGYRLRGLEQVVRAIEDVKRVIEIGIRGILVYDEGLLWILNEMRQAGELPAELHLKVSAHCGHANPAAFRMLVLQGADSINPVRDLQMPMIAALRQAVDVPLDVHTDNPPASGGFIRVYEAPEMVRVAAPVHLKTGNSAIGAHGSLTSEADGRRMAVAATITAEMVKRYFPEAKQTERGSDDLAIPV
jgi:hypothetical protein